MPRRIALLVAAALVAAGPGAALGEEPMEAFSAELSDRLGQAPSRETRITLLEAMLRDGDAPGATPTDLTFAGFAATILSGNEMTAGCRYFERAARAGGVTAMHLYGECFSNGHLTENAPENIETWFTRAAEAGNWTSLCALGELRMQGRYLVKDFDRGVAECRKAAENGSTNAQLTLGDLHQSGALGEEDIDAAVAWYTKALEGGNSRGARNLAQLHYLKKHLQPSLDEAIALAELSARDGDPRAAAFAADFLLRKMATGTEDADVFYEQMLGDMGWRAYYWARRAFQQGNDRIVKEHGKEMLDLIAKTVLGDQLKEWDARYRRTLPSAM